MKKLNVFFLALTVAAFANSALFTTLKADCKTCKGCGCGKPTQPTPPKK